MTTPCWLFGVPFDVATLEQVRARIFAAVSEREQLIFTTPNVNFLARANSDSRFREDILRAKLSLADGMPIVWMGRLLGIPFSERIAGSDLLESLIVEPGPRPLRVFFFGGVKGAAEAAMQAVNERAGGLVAVGACFPGFIPVEQMSDDATIDQINRCNPDFLVVALGAAKGHRWIESNRHRLKVPVISHLGAAVNFVAGRLRRAPLGLQRLGLEWTWRIKEEPVLFRRYARDAWFLAQLLLGFVLPEAASRWFRGNIPSSLRVTSSGEAAVTILASRRFGIEEVDAISKCEPCRRLPDGAALHIELNGVTQLDAQGVGWLYAARYRFGGRPPATFKCDSVSMATLKYWRADFLSGDL